MTPHHERLPDTNKLRIHLVKMLKYCEHYISIPEEDIVLILYLLNTEDRILQFLKWLQPRIEVVPPQVTAVELCGAASLIYAGRTDLP